MHMGSKLDIKFCDINIQAKNVTKSMYLNLIDLFEILLL